MNFPSDLKYTKDHEWFQTSGNDGVIGITAYAVDQLGDIVHVELPSVGKTYSKGDSFGTVESTKTVSDLYMPVKGEVVGVNQDALKAPETLQQDPYKKGWLVKIKVKNSSELNELLSAKDYETFVADQ